MKKAIAILLIAVLALTCFAACGKKDKEAVDPTGVYVVKTFNGKTMEEYLKEYVVEQGGEQMAALMESMDLEALLKAAGLGSMDDFMNLELKADGTASMTMQGEKEEGTWKQDGDKVTVTIDDDPVEFTLSGNELSAEVDDQSMVFVKK